MRSMVVSAQHIEAVLNRKLENMKTISGEGIRSVMEVGYLTTNAVMGKMIMQVENLTEVPKHLTNGVAYSDCVVLSLHSTKFFAASSIESYTHMQTVPFLDNQDGRAGRDPRRLLKTLATKSKKMVLQRGQHLVRRGDKIGEVFFVRSGQLKVEAPLFTVQKCAEADNNATQVPRERHRLVEVAMIGGGDIVDGCQLFTDTGHHGANVIATSKVVAFKVQAQDFAWCLDKTKYQEFVMLRKRQRAEQSAAAVGGHYSIQQVDAEESIPEDQNHEKGAKDTTGLVSPATPPSTPKFSLPKAITKSFAMM